MVTARRIRAIVFHCEGECLVGYTGTGNGFCTVLRRSGKWDVRMREAASDAFARYGLPRPRRFKHVR